MDAPSLGLGGVDPDGRREPGSAAAIASALAHIETALENLERGTEEMESLARARLAQATVLLGGPWNQDLAARTARRSRAGARERAACLREGSPKRRADSR